MIDTEDKPLIYYRIMVPSTNPVRRPHLMTLSKRQAENPEKLSTIIKRLLEFIAWRYVDGVESEKRLCSQSEKQVKVSKALYLDVIQTILR